MILMREDTSLYFFENKHEQINYSAYPLFHLEWFNILKVLCLHELQAPAYIFSTFQYPPASSHYGELNFCGVCHDFRTTLSIHTGFGRIKWDPMAYTYQWVADKYTQTSICIFSSVTKMTWLKLEVQWIPLLIVLCFEDMWVLIASIKSCTRILWQLYL